MDVDTYTVTGRDGDLFLICSDGLTSMVSDDELAAILRSAGSLEDTAEALVRAANQSGGKDNITVVLFRLGDDRRRGVPARPPTRRSRARSRSTRCGGGRRRRQAGPAGRRAAARGLPPTRP